MCRFFQITVIFLLTIFSVANAADPSNVYVSAAFVRIRVTPSTSGQVVTMLPLGTWAKILEKSPNKQNLLGQSDYWYKIEANGKQGWIFGGLTVPTTEEDRFSTAINLINSRLEMQDKPLEDQVQLYEFAASVKELASHSAEKAKLELAYLKTIQNVCQKLSLDGKGQDSSNSVIAANQDKVYLHECAGQHFVNSAAYWDLSEKYSDFPQISDEIAWAAALQTLQGETEGDPSAMLSHVELTKFKYLEKFPSGTSADTALKDSAEALNFIRSGLTADYFADETYGSKKDFIERVKKIEQTALKAQDSPARKEFLNSVSEIYRHLGN